MTSIQNEFFESQKYVFDFLESSNFLIDLSLRNVAIVEAMLRIDSMYSKALNPEAKDSTAYWMTKLKDFYESKNKKDADFKKIIQGAVAAVDRDNSTHLNADKDKNGGRNKIVKRLIKFGEEKMYKSLLNRRFDLFNVLAEKTSEEKGARKNPSFASKFCHYACFYLFEGNEAQDNFSIYDSTMRKIIPLYATYYGIECDKELLDSNSENFYAYYSKTIDEILKKSGHKISRNGFDHLLWYYYKGRI